MAGFSTQTVKHLFGSMSYSAVGRKGNSFRSPGANGVTLTVQNRTRGLLRKWFLKSRYAHHKMRTWEEVVYPTFSNGGSCRIVLGNSPRALRRSMILGQFWSAF